LLAKQLQNLLSPRDLFRLNRRKGDRPWEVSGHAMFSLLPLEEIEQLAGQKLSNDLK